MQARLFFVEARMKKTKSFLKAEYEQRVLRSDEIVAPEYRGDLEKLKAQTAVFLLSGAPEISVAPSGKKFSLLSDVLEFHAALLAGIRQFPARVYKFSEKEGEIYRLIFKLKTDLPIMDEAYVMQELCEKYDFTQEKIARATGKSRPAVANTMRLLKLQPEVIGLIESGKLSAGHARALIVVPKEKQYPFALETVQKNCSVRQTERAVKAFMTPATVLESEKAAKNAAVTAELKAFVERMRAVYKTKVTLVGNDKKGRISIDYYCADDLYRFEEFLSVIENFQGKK